MSVNKTLAPVVGCAGILVADLFCGPMDALPNEGMLAVLDDMPTRAGGCAANVAIDLVKQNIPVELFGSVGVGGYGLMLVKELQAAGVSTEHISRIQTHSTSKTVILLISGQDRRYLHTFGANAAFKISHINRRRAEKLKVFYLGGLFALPGIDPKELADLFRHLRSKGVVTVLDVVLPENFQDHQALETILPLTDYFLPNEDEAKIITGQSAPLDQVHALNDMGAQRLVITRGKQGAFASDGKSYWECGVYPTEIVDPSGSGDAFCSGVITGIVEGYDMPETLKYASALGASAARKIGTTTGIFTSEEANRFISKQRLDLISGTIA